LRKRPKWEIAQRASKENETPEANSPETGVLETDPIKLDFTAIAVGA
jgi:hypothetical protein